MAKRKSVTGIRKKKKILKQKASNEFNVDDVSESPTEDMLQRPAPGQLIHIRDTADLKSQARISAARRRDNEQPTVPVSRNRTQAGTSHDALEARQEHVSQMTIETQWDKLDVSTQQAIQALLAGVHIPVLCNFNSERSKGEAQEFLQSVRDSLLKRLPKTPFPRGTADSDFDYERLTKTNEDTQLRLDQAAAMITSLKQTIDEQESALEAEQQNIDHMNISHNNVNTVHSDSNPFWYPQIAAVDQAPNDLPDRIQLIDRHASSRDRITP